MCSSDLDEQAKTIKMNAITEWAALPATEMFLRDNRDDSDCKRIPDQKRAGEMRDMIGKLGTAFSRFSDSLVDADLKGIDVELKLLEATLKDDMGTPS